MASWLHRIPTLYLRHIACEVTYLWPPWMTGIYHPRFTSQMIGIPTAIIKEMSAMVPGGAPQTGGSRGFLIPLHILLVLTSFRTVLVGGTWRVSYRLYHRVDPPDPLTLRAIKLGNIT